jgi:hypothetical protein
LLCRVAPPAPQTLKREIPPKANSAELRRKSLAVLDSCDHLCCAGASLGQPFVGVRMKLNDHDFAFTN